MELGLTAAEPTVSAARKCQTVSRISEHVCHEASALCNTTACKHLSLVATAHMPDARGKTAHPALSEQALARTLPKLSLFSPS